MYGGLKISSIIIIISCYKLDFEGQFQIDVTACPISPSVQYPVLLEVVTCVSTYLKNKLLSAGKIKLR